LTSFERFICERENLVFDSLIYLEPMKRFENRSNVMKFRSFSNIIQTETAISIFSVSSNTITMETLHTLYDVRAVKNQILRPLTGSGYRIT